MIEKILRGRLAFALILLFYSLFLWKLSVPLTGDQKVYLSIALEMRERNEWVIPYLFGKPSFFKPPFQYWATLIGWKFFGFNLFGALIPSVLAMLGSAVLIRKFKGASSLHSVFFCSTLATLTYGTTGQMEIWIVLFYLASWYFWVTQREVRAWILAGAMAAVKSPLYSVLFGVSAILERLIQRKWKSLLTLKMLGGIVLGIGVSLAWYALAARTHLQMVLDVFLRRENLEKLNTPLGSPFGLWSEFVLTLFPLLPWFLYGLFTEEFKEKWKAQGKFWILYAAIPALFFTGFPYRVNTYLYLLTPVAIWMLNTKETRYDFRFKKFWVGLVGLIALFLCVLIIRLYSGHWIQTGLFLLIGSSVFFWFWAHLKSRPTWIALSSLLLVTGIRLAGIQVGEWDLSTLREFHSRNQTKLAYFITGPGDIWHEFGLVSAAIGEQVTLLRSDVEVEDFLRQKGALILSDEQNERARGLNCETWTRLKKRAGFRMKDLLLDGLSIEDPALHREFKICRL
jgi:4-amino-4-deoxy-L-arabinose transferase-like glycosyltransferase